ncbi:hypothetical protein B0T21DRAFT_354451 [Apiosordaria backusii]|uniref:Secreted protein n=1 Tax=Apiosordaria backusii TaxID=314023 RepID=A0AA40EXR2_9PEZI|nr:hypothetical protein B0T21DRAFT_354451 [Apiosordaria backusii]
MYPPFPLVIYLLFLPLNHNTSRAAKTPRLKPPPVEPNPPATTTFILIVHPPNSCSIHHNYHPDHVHHAHSAFTN